MLVAVGAAVGEAFELQTAPVASVVRPIPAGEGLLLAFSLLHQPDIWPQGTAEHHYHASFSYFLVSHLHSLLHQNQQQIKTLPMYS